MKIYVRDFSDTPGPRFKRLGRYSAEEFRETLLRALRESETAVEVVLDGTRGYGSSFLEEVFGGIVRENAFSIDDLRRRLIITAETRAFDSYAKEANGYFQDALAALKK